MSIGMQPIFAARQSISQTFDTLRHARQIGFMPFIPAGFPDLATTAALLPALEQAGANVIEIGIPFSDPVADGPVIQEAFTAALAKKLHVSDIFTCIASARKNVSIPLVAMVSYSIVFRYNVERFCRDARSSGFDGLIIPDLPPPEAQKVCDIIRAADLDTILLVAPTTAPHRRKEIAQLCTGFVYYLSVSGITGERTSLPADLVDNVTQLKQLTDRPVCVGFGVSTPQHVAMLAGVADGAIVGSALVKRIQQYAPNGRQAVIEACAEYSRELLSLVRK